MKKIFTSIVVAMWILAACAPQQAEQPTEQSLLPNDNPGIQLDFTPAQQASITLLSETLGLPAEKITLVSTESVTWPDGCLGVQRIGIMCTQALVEGYKIVLGADGTQYEFHTNVSGSSVVLASDLSDLDMVQQALKLQLASNLGIDISQISVVSDNPVEFGDACLGVAMQNVMCAEVITPGRIVVLEADGVQYEYHASNDGSRIQPATFALTWQRSGGIAGFCDSVTVFLSGEIYGNQCKSQPNGTMNTFDTLLSASEQLQFNEWISDYGQVTLDASDPKGVSDRMTLIVELYGNGNGKPGKPVQDKIFTWMQDIYNRLYQ